MLDVKVVPIEDLTLDPRNARVHSEENRRAIRASVSRFGPGRSIVLDGSNVVRAGNGTLEAARLEGVHEVIVIEPMPGQLVAVRRPDWSDSEATAYALADNRAAESATWDNLILAQSLDRLPDDVRPATGFDDAYVSSLLERLATDRAGGLDVSSGAPASTPPGGPDPLPAPAPAPPDRHAELVAKWRTAPGQVWTIPSVSTSGRSHRVVCGDCREAGDVAAALAALGGVDGVFTSPPYAEQRASHYGGIPADQYVEWFDAVQANARAAIKPDGSMFVNIKPHCEAGQRSLYVNDLVSAMVRCWGWLWVDEFAWTRSGVPGRWPNRFKNQFEPIHHFALCPDLKFRPENVAYASARIPQCKPGSKSKGDSGMLAKDGTPDGPGLAYPGNVIAIEAENGLAGLHSAPFPVALPERFILAFSDPGDTWLDPFLGSGTTLLAAERTGRLAIGLECKPEHVAVILERASQIGLSPALS